MAPLIVGPEPTVKQHTVQMTFPITGAPDVDSDHGTLTPTELAVTYSWYSDRPAQSDVSIRFGNVPGHFPVKHYFAATEQWRPRPDWINEAVAQHAPEWWLK